jgi:hypothetical protein
LEGGDEINAEPLKGRSSYGRKNGEAKHGNWLIFFLNYDSCEAKTKFVKHALYSLDQGIFSWNNKDGNLLTNIWITKWQCEVWARANYIKGDGAQLAEYISQILLKYYIPTIEMLAK